MFYEGWKDVLQSAMGGVSVRGGLLGTNGKSNYMSGAGGQVLGTKKRRIQETWKEACKYFKVIEVIYGRPNLK